LLDFMGVGLEYWYISGNPGYQLNMNGALQRFDNGAKDVSDSTYLSLQQIQEVLTGVKNESVLRRRYAAALKNGHNSPKVELQDTYLVEALLELAKRSIKS
jgi:hypothetical protein